MWRGKKRTLARMLKIPPKVGALMIGGLDAEISRQEAIGRVCGDEWPDDYDPNDVAIYRGFRSWLKEHVGRDAVVDCDYTSKPARFVMGMIPYFVRQSIDQLSPADVEAAFRTFSEYVALACHDLIKGQSAQGYPGNWMLRWHAAILEFPRKEHAADPRAPAA
jgi:hypothetical protein